MAAATSSDGATSPVRCSSINDDPCTPTPTLPPHTHSHHTHTASHADLCVACAGSNACPPVVWCVLAGTDLVHWTRQPPSVWFDPTSPTGNGSNFDYFHGNCGTGGGVVNAGGELVVYCPHDAAGVHAFGAPSATNFTELRLLDRAPAKIAMPMPPASALPAGDGTSDPGTPFLASDGKWYQVLGGRGKASHPTCHRTDRMSHCCQWCEKK